MMENSSDELAYRVPSVFHCLAQLVLVKVALNCLGFGRTVALYGGSAVVAVADDNGSERIVEKVARQVSAAAALYPGRALCLEQSLVLHRALMRRGVASRIRFGVQPYPFGGHAWVEYRGRAVNENAQRISQLTPLEG
jgi:hypothetical protein